MAEITTLRRKRSGYKSVVHKLSKKLEELLFEDTNNYKHEQLKVEIVATNDILIEKELIIKDLDEKIIDSLDDENDFEREIEQCTEYEITLKKIHEKVRTRYSTPQQTMKRNESLHSNLTRNEEITSQPQSNVRLPPIDMKRFNGILRSGLLFMKHFYLLFI